MPAMLGGSAPTPAESAGHEARVRAAPRSLERSRPLSVHPPAGSRGEERERSPRGTSAIAAALAAAAAEAEAEAFASTDDYMPDAEPDADAGEPSAPLSPSSGSGDSIGELPSCAAPSAPAVLRLTWKPPGRMLTPLKPLLMPRLQPPSPPPWGLCHGTPGRSTRRPRRGHGPASGR